MSLKGRCVLVTRPPLQAAPLKHALQAAGAAVIELPLIDIEALAPPPALANGNYDWILFTSPNAVRHGLPLLGSRLHNQRLAAIGGASAAALQAAGFSPVSVPAQEYSSEGLLAMPEFRSPRQQRILLVKGQGGRTLLADSLRQRGAELSEFVVYRRRLLQPSAQQIHSAVSRADAAIVTSGEILQRLFELTPADALQKLLALQLVVPSERVVQMAQLLGFCHVHSVSSPLTDVALVQALQQPGS